MDTRKTEKKAYEQMFKYRAISSDGNAVNDVIAALDISDAKKKLKQKGVSLISISQSYSFMEKIKGNRVSKIDLVTVSMFCGQLYAIISSGVNILTGVHILSRMTRDKNLKKVVSLVNGEIQKGKSISVAMDSEKTGLPLLLVNMIEVGEKSGSLDEILKDMASYYEKEALTKSKVVGAMIYPIILSVVGVAMLLFFMNFVMPEIIGIIKDTGAALPLITRVVMVVIDFIKAYGLLAFGIIVVLGILAKVLVPRDKMRKFIHSFILKIPLVGIMVRNLASARFLRTSSLMIKSGIPIPDILESAEKTLGNHLAEEAIRKARDGINKGENLSTNLLQSNFFDPMVVELMSIGEETGQLEGILINLTTYVEKETEQSISKLIAAIEPIFTIVIGITIGILIIAMMLPMFGMISNLKK